MKRLVLNISRMTTHNGPGIRTLILFKGCPLRCLWCSTPESQLPVPEIAVFPAKCIRCGKCVTACPVNAINIENNLLSINRFKCNNCGECARICYSEAVKLLGQPMSIDELIEEAKKDLIIYRHSGGGVTISGGEPLLDTGFTGELLKKLKQENISIGVDTSGYIPWSKLKPMLPYIDFFLWDIKHMDPEKHIELTGVSNELILSNARAVSERNVPIYIRIPVIPGCNDSEENIKATSEFGRSLPSVVEIGLLPLHHLGKARYESLNRTYPIADLHLIPDSVMQHLKLLAESCHVKCNIVG